MIYIYIYIYIHIYIIVFDRGGETFCWNPSALLGTILSGLIQIKFSQVSRGGRSNYMPQILWVVITCPCPWYPLLLNKYSYVLEPIITFLCSLEPSVGKTLTTKFDKVDCKVRENWLHFRSSDKVIQNCRSELTKNFLYRIGNVTNDVTRLKGRSFHGFVYGAFPSPWK